MFTAANDNLQRQPNDDQRPKKKKEGWKKLTAQFQQLDIHVLKFLNKYNFYKYTPF